METRTGGTPPAGTEPDRACHDLLVAMAGRLPDRLLWRLRDWLACGADVALRTAVPRALLRHRVGVTESERELLRAAVLGRGGSARLVDAVLHTDAPPAPAASFAAQGDAPGWDSTDLVLRALVPAVAGAGDLRRAWRTDRASRRSTPPPPARVVLLDADGDLPALTGAVQRALRAHGEVDPRVEVLGADTPLTAYHREALAASEVLWRADAPAAASGSYPPRPPDARRDPTTTGELVRHG